MRPKPAKAVPTRVKVKNFRPILGAHPTGEVFIAKALTGEDEHTTTKKFPHRKLLERPKMRNLLVSELRACIKIQHASPDQIKRDKKRRAALKKLGFEAEAKKIKRFPKNTDTRKGNLAEVLLAEYLTAVCHATVPVFRLRYNPNVDQSMKGDDVLLFDFDSSPARVVVGEAKFRSRSSSTTVTKMIEALGVSLAAGTPASLMFVADRLFEEGNSTLGEQVSTVPELLAKGQVELVYVGFLLSDSLASTRIKNTSASFKGPLALVSLSVDNPTTLVAPCYRGLT